jgi:NAD(P)-dependent dehydrogenase (short-subunit alcohol dehydrogenase family)
MHETGSLDDELKRALITGEASGIGLTTVHALFGARALVVYGTTGLLVKASDCS